MIGYRLKKTRGIRRIRKSVTLAGILIAAALLMAPPVIAADTGYAMTAYGGYRGGGSFTDADTDKGLKLESNGAVSLALDLPCDAARQYQIFVSQQRTNLLLDNAASAGSSNRLPMDIYYLHFGGTFFWDGQVGKGAYVVGGLGATLFNPDQGYKSELYPSINVGFGYQWLLGNTFAVRVEARGYGTLVNSSGGVFCSGGCVVSIKGDSVGQGELMLGLSTRF
jgi:hypothetical protein